MDKQAKLKKMWKNLPSMTNKEMMEELKLLGVKQSYEEIVQALSKTYDDLQVADHIFETCTIDDAKSQYPKEFVDEAVLKIAQQEDFGFQHYGVITQNIQALQDPFLSKELIYERSKVYFQQFLSLCKKFKVDNFDAFVYTINDQFDMGKAVLSYLSFLQEQHRDHREVAQYIDRFFQIFTQVNAWLDEQLQFLQASSLIALKSSKGEKMFQSFIQNFVDVTECIYRYMLAYTSIDKKKMLGIYERNRKLLQKDSEFYDKVINLTKN